MKRIVIVTISMLLIFSSGCVEKNNNHEDRNQYYEELSILINSTVNVNYTFLIPLIIDNNDNYLDFQNNLTDKFGNSIIIIENNENGLMLNITGNGDSEIIMRNEIEEMYEEYFYYTLTMLNSSFSVNGFFNFNYYFESEDTLPIVLEFNFQAVSKISGRNIHFIIENPSSGSWSVGTGFGGGGSD